MTQDRDADRDDWDIALAGLLDQEYRRLQRDLAAADLAALARDNATRLDDILHTLIALCGAGRWHYVGGDGSPGPAPAGLTEALGAGRIEEQALEGFGGRWQPAG